MPPYVSTMIFRPVRPASPIGPPDDEAAGGIDVNERILRAQLRRDRWQDDRLHDLRPQLLVSDAGSCWAAITTFVTRLGTPRSYSTVTWVLPSGRR